MPPRLATPSVTAPCCAYGRSLARADCALGATILSPIHHRIACMRAGSRALEHDSFCKSARSQRCCTSRAGKSKDGCPNRRAARTARVAVYSRPHWPPSHPSLQVSRTSPLLLAAPNARSASAAPKRASFAPQRSGGVAEQGLHTHPGQVSIPALTHTQPTKRGTNNQSCALPLSPPCAAVPSR